MNKQVLRSAQDDKSRAEVLPTLGRVVAFVVMLVLCSTAATWFFAPLAAKVISSTGQPLKLDVFPNLLGVVVATALLLRSIDQRPWSAVDLDKRAAALGPLAAGLAWGGAAIVGVCAVLLGSRLLVINPAPAFTSWASAAALTTLILLPAALAEEVMCRGYLLTVVRECVGTVWAVVLTSAMFGALHMMNPDATAESVIVVVVAGMFLAMVRITTRSLYAAWMAHFAWNWVMAVPLHATVSGIGFAAPGYVAVTAGPEWLSGGRWGPEGGAIAAVGLCLALGILYARHRREES